ncbi:MAG: enoyl-CoA hydratase/isomerase family protein [Actinobacteria bacterium]|nr:enoyl-CoA hydratase/isomerase family protein [Actinomycetota bacterium]MBU4240288.1 enoyl-CoA hydratase/isomerase family protein [Actinomycetota bacterium]MBU4301511.1 enoyl-CoA hydratase/isomerase family protein [Actinomycetota bacterium]MBU4489663.1 enoyl-CoA hydratase/isomerase family protein [Actinomycetota bacterium]MCG2795078.1 enoyl-CoA hydratase-related protein [Actinomycetes bacterium]
MAYDFEFLKVDIEEGVATVQLDRPKVNALNGQVFLEIGNCATELQYDDEVRAVVITGGEKVFAAGADIKEMVDATPAQVAKIIGGAQDSLNRLENVLKPVIAAVNGFALGGGCELALAADWRFAGETAQIGVPEILLGIIPGAGGTQRLPRLIGTAKAKEMIFSGHFYDAGKCLEYGVVDKVVEGDGAAVIAEAQKVARRYATRYPPIALAMAKRSVNNGINCSITDGLAIEAQSIAICFSTEDQTIGMETFIKEGPGKAKFIGK